eukprot:gene14171-19013_t
MMEKSVDDNFYNSNYEIPSDTEILISTIIESESKLFHSFVLLHQIYSILSNHSIVDEDVQNIRLSPTNPYRIIQSSIHSTVSHKSTLTPNQPPTIIIPKNVYKQDLKMSLSVHSSLEENEQQKIFDQFSYWIDSSNNFSVLRRELLMNNTKDDQTFISENLIKCNDTSQNQKLDVELTSPTLNESSTKVDLSSTASSKYKRKADNIEVNILNNHQNKKISSVVSPSVNSLHSLSNENIELLIRLGYLSVRVDVHYETKDQETFWISHPSIGTLLSHINSAQKEIVSWICATRYKELSEKKLISRKFVTSNSILPISYHLSDLIGRKVLYKVASPAKNDYFVRLAS